MRGRKGKRGLLLLSLLLSLSCSLGSCAREVEDLPRGHPAEEAETRAPQEPLGCRGDEECPQGFRCQRISPSSYACVQIAPHPLASQRPRAPLERLSGAVQRR